MECIKEYICPGCNYVSHYVTFKDILWKIELNLTVTF